MIAYAEYLRICGAFVDKRAALLRERAEMLAFCFKKITYGGNRWQSPSSTLKYQPNKSRAATSCWFTKGESQYAAQHDRSELPPTPEPTNHAAMPARADLCLLRGIHLEIQRPNGTQASRPGAIFLMQRS